MTASVAAGAAAALVVLLATRAMRLATARPAGWSPRVVRLVTELGASGARRSRSASDPLVDVVRLRTAIAGGASPWQACGEVAAGVGPWAAGMRRVVAGGPGRAPLGELLDGWAEHAGDPAARLVADAVVLAGETGGSLVGALDAVAETVRERSAIEREVRALASSARASAAVLVATPIAFSLAIAAIDARVRSFLLGSVAGIGCIVVGVVLNLLGGWWMQRQIAAVS